MQTANSKMIKNRSYFSASVNTWSNILHQYTCPTWQQNSKYNI